MNYPKGKSLQQWQAQLPAEVFSICFQAGTEAPFSGEYHDLKSEGVYQCRCCQTNLFSSQSKFDSGSGWPSYFAPIEDGLIIEKSDSSHGMVRTEILCSSCGAHLGHVFSDGPQPTGRRYCVNSLSLFFINAGV